MEKKKEKECTDLLEDNRQQLGMNYFWGTRVKREARIIPRFLSWEPARIDLFSIKTNTGEEEQMYRLEVMICSISFKK